MENQTPVEIKAPGRWQIATVTKIKVETPTVKSFRFELPMWMQHLPGQHYDVRLTAPDGYRAERSYSIASSPLDEGIVELTVDRLDGGVVLSVGSAIMGPQVFEKSLSCVNNIRLQSGGEVVKGHSIYVVDLQDGGGWDWSAGEPPKTHPAYYLRFCKSYSRMGGAMHYLQMDNACSSTTSTAN